MAQVIAGEIEKMGILYERYKKPLYAYFFKLTSGDSQTSEDLVHTVFYRVIRYRTSFTGEGTFAKWLFRIAHNAGLDHNRKIRASNDHKDKLYSTKTVLYENNDLEIREQHETLAKALNILKPEEKELLVLGKIDCLKYKEIAGILNTTESNVKIRMFRALKKLKDIYMKLENPKYEKARS